MFRTFNAIRSFISRPDETPNHTPLPLTTWETFVLVYVAVRIYMMAGGAF